MALRQLVELDIEGHDLVTVTYSAVDMRRWEAVHKKSVLVEPMSLSMLTWLGWNAAVRQGVIDGALKDWRKFDEVCVGVRTLRDPADEPVEPVEPVEPDEQPVEPAEPDEQPDDDEGGVADPPTTRAGHTRKAASGKA